jgi:predicted ATPase with chaperone activity
MPKTVLVGLAETAVKERTHRVERAIVNSGYRRAIDRVVINLAPARSITRLSCPTSPFTQSSTGVTLTLLDIVK